MKIEKIAPEMVSKLTQDPHVVRGKREHDLEAAIGRQVRVFRRRQEVTVAELATSSGLSIGMLSKIENGNTSPSLTTLRTLANALSVPLTAFFRQFEESREGVHTKDADSPHGPERLIRLPTRYLSIISYPQNT